MVLPLSWLLMGHPRLWKPFILLASYVFYSAASWKFCFLLAGVTAVNQLAATQIAAAASERRERGIVASVVTIDLGALAVFKYYGFFAQQVSSSMHDVGLG